ncbi:DUF6884 domain-containing protein [Saccharothrix sp. Mg75]|uniref:DUF6884 domain-containing protein n=1 Tax=Saccharothrix sp. Mg75 TaxID=3445357 RepID=UPI003EEDE78D
MRLGAARAVEPRRASLRRPAPHPAEHHRAGWSGTGPVRPSAGAARKQLFVVPCSSTKLDIPAPARSLYTGSMFRYCFAIVEREAALTTAAGIPTRVVILSARHGLVDPDTEIAPYEQSMTTPGAVAAWRLADQLAAITDDHHTEIVAFLPKAYVARLREALDLIRRHHTHTLHLRDAYQAAPGIGHQRRVLADLRRSQEVRHHIRPQ